jgi:hypothetical protein
MRYIIVTPKQAGSVSTPSTTISWNGPGSVGTVNYTIIESPTYLLIALRERPIEWSNPSSVFASDGTIIANELNLGGIAPKDDSSLKLWAAGVVGLALGYTAQSKSK